MQTGVREGITAGTQCTLQDGFNCGYRQSFFKSYNFGKVRGMLRQAFHFHNIAKSTGDKTWKMTM